MTIDEFIALKDTVNGVSYQLLSSVTWTAGPVLS